MLKIVLAVSRFPVLSETFIVNKFIELVKEGMDVHIVCGEFDEKIYKSLPAFKNREYKRRIHSAWPAKNKTLAVFLYPFMLLKLLCTAPVKTVLYLIRGFAHLKFSIFSKLYFDAGFIALDPGIIHFEFGALAAGKTYLKKLLRCRLAVSFRGYDLNFSGLNNTDYYRDVWREADAVHCLGENLWLKAVKRGCPPDKKHFLISPAVDVEDFNPNKDRKGGGVMLRILGVGRLEWKKGYEFAMQAAQILKKQGIVFEFRIAGEGDYLEALTFCRRQLGLEKEVVLLGKLNPEQVKLEMEKADLLLHAAVSEGFCNAVVEAQAMKLPVVCSDAGGLPENIENGETGFVVPRRNPAAMAEKVRVLAGDPAFRASMGEKGRQRVLKKFRLHDQTLKFRDFYSEILAM